MCVYIYIYIYVSNNTQTLNTLTAMLVQGQRDPQHVAHHDPLRHQTNRFLNTHVFRLVGQLIECLNRITQLLSNAPKGNGIGAKAS